jgi:hypothetical protein
MSSSKIHGDRANTSRSRSASFEPDSGYITNLSGEGYKDAFSLEASELKKRREEFSLKIANAKKGPISDNEKRQLLAEYANIQQAQKLLEHIVNSSQQTKQNIAANMR